MRRHVGAVARGTEEQHEADVNSVDRPDSTAPALDPSNRLNRRDTELGWSGPVIQAKEINYEQQAVFCFAGRRGGVRLGSDRGAGGTNTRIRWRSLSRRDTTPNRS